MLPVPKVQRAPQPMTVWDAVKRTPASSLKWLLLGAALPHGITMLEGQRTLPSLLTGTLVGFLLGLVLRAVIVAARARQPS